MTINLEYIIRNQRGEDVMIKENVPMTVRHIIQECLANDDPRNPPSAEEKLTSGRLLFTKLLDKNPDFTVEELAHMKKRCGAGCTSMTWFQVERILDGKADALVTD